MRGSDVGGANPQGARSIAKVGEVGADLREPRCRAAGDVLDDETRGAKLSDDAAELEPEPALGSSEPSALACARDVLARESSADDIHGKQV